ncbi:ABC transporter substrate-binding protein, partial [Catenibacillus scindens]|uniref:ABC transporter substrate-binding protein n=1 Tax=Catenibacillus scindens TaxID=673271 RepID=UPI003207ABC2
MKTKTLTHLALTILLTAGLTVSSAGCGSTAGSNGSGSGDAGRIDAQSVRADNQADSQTSSAGGSGETVQISSETGQNNGLRTEYPLTMTTYGPDGQEYSMVFEKAPEKVVAVYQGCIETLLALGLEDHIVATAGLDNEVPDNLKAAFSSTNYLDEFTPSKETVTMLEPDMIFSWSSYFREDTLGSPDEWIGSGTNVYINTNTAVSSDSLENEFNDILNIGKIFDVQDRAQAIVDEMKNTISTVKELAAEQSDSPSVLVIENLNGTFTNYGASSIAGDMVTQLGGTLANPDAPTLGEEDIIAADPDV